MSVSRSRGLGRGSWTPAGLRRGAASMRLGRVGASPPPCLAGRGLANGHHGRYFGGYGPVGNLTDISALICRFPGEISPKMRK
ncbi:hypothetical protein [Bacillus sp. 3255]|uniref:hypothetical protein n=1 Tax=Bacillus sp. 3255 TaxID=2817904 RepID=UPI002861F142|nr:hypothetical protein [Bacillus sp. 3255]MDR6884769.1 hypothetical protein [Bacillus sp. 3255]